MSVKMKTLTMGSITYEITDEESRNRLSILEKQNGTYNIAFLGCDDSDTYDSTRGYGNCTVIYNEDVCVVVDFGNDSNASTLLDFLDDKGITSVDAVIISHYHADHVRTGSVSALLNSNVDTSNCVWYLPHNGVDWLSFTGKTYASEEAAIVNLLSDETYIHPSSEGQTIDFGDFTISFYNVTSSLYTDYYSYLYDDGMVLGTNTNYNNFSMVCLVSGQGVNTVLTADIERPAEYNVCKVISQADILQIPHHGLDVYPNEKALSSVKAKLSILQSYGVPKTRAFSTAIRPYVAKGMEKGTVVSTYNFNTIVCNIYNGVVIIDEVSSDDYVSGNVIGTMIIGDSDLDDVLTAGTYYIKDASTASTITNVPIVNGNPIGAGELVVLGGTNNANGYTQIYVPMYSTKRYICIRTKTANGWGDWGILDLTISDNVEYSRVVSNAIGQKNLAQITATDTTTNGLTFTINDDNSFTVYGTATANTVFVVCGVQLTNGNTYYIGGCPKGGSLSTYRLYFTYASDDQVDIGEGASYTSDADINRQLRFAVSSGVTMSHRIYPVVFE